MTRITDQVNDLANGLLDTDRSQRVTDEQRRSRRTGVILSAGAAAVAGGLIAIAAASNPDAQTTPRPTESTSYDQNIQHGHDTMEEVGRQGQTPVDIDPGN